MSTFEDFESGFVASSGNIVCCNIHGMHQITSACNCYKHFINTYTIPMPFPEIYDKQEDDELETYEDYAPLYPDGVSER